jgi:hypothetical protein
MDTKKFLMIYIIVFLIFSLVGNLFSYAYSAYDPLTGESIAPSDSSVFTPGYWKANLSWDKDIWQYKVPIIGDWLGDLSIMTYQAAGFFASLVFFDVPWIPADYWWIRAFIVIPFIIAVLWIIVAYMRGIGDG